MGNPKPLTNFNTNKTRTFNGRALLILAKNQQLSSIQIAVHSNNDSKKDEIVGQLTIEI
ncbi:hypothetical protein QQG08_05695 [Melissococcus plutonius]|uniref:hypothetical protein n=1 Tax=Melissococcus plutonius TaxID=33970 RepID=UPI003EE66256